MLARKLEAFVKQSVKAGGGIELITIAKALLKVVSREQKVPLRLPLGGTAVMLIKKKLEGQLKDLEDVKELSAVG